MYGIMHGARNVHSSLELQQLQCITLNGSSEYAHRDWIEEQRFPLIHNIILGRSKEVLNTELMSNLGAASVKDTIGRTALDWATALAQLSVMKILIDHGSPVNTMDVTGRSTVLHAVDSHNEDALLIVLQAGADPNPELQNGIFRSSPLTAASFGGLVGMMKLLLKFGAHVNACNPEGRTALHTVASMHNVECAEILLAHGADIGYMSSNGHSPLTTAIAYNNHPVLKLFIDRCETNHLRIHQLLSIIAKSADAKTISILATSDLVKHTLNGEGVVASRATLRARTDYGEELGNAFDHFSSQLIRPADGSIGCWH